MFPMLPGSKLSSSSCRSPVRTSLVSPHNSTQWSNPPDQFVTSSACAFWKRGLTSWRACEFWKRGLIDPPDQFVTSSACDFWKRGLTQPPKKFTVNFACDSQACYKGHLVHMFLANLKWIKLVLSKLPLTNDDKWHEIWTIWNKSGWFEASYLWQVIWPTRNDLSWF
jgi:hypothetical protein